MLCPPPPCQFMSWVFVYSSNFVRPNTQVIAKIKLTSNTVLGILSNVYGLTPCYATHPHVSSRHGSWPPTPCHGSWPPPHVISRLLPEGQGCCPRVEAVAQRSRLLPKGQGCCPRVKAFARGSRLLPEGQELAILTFPVWT